MAVNKSSWTLQHQNQTNCCYFYLSIQNKDWNAERIKKQKPLAVSAMFNIPLLSQCLRQQHFPDCHMRCLLHCPTLHSMEKWSHSFKHHWLHPPVLGLREGWHQCSFTWAQQTQYDMRREWWVEHCPQYGPRFSQWDIVFNYVMLHAAITPTEQQEAGK